MVSAVPRSSRYLVLEAKTKVQLIKAFPTDFTGPSSVCVRRLTHPTRARSFSLLLAMSRRRSCSTRRTVGIGYWNASCHDFRLCGSDGDGAMTRKSKPAGLQSSVVVIVIVVVVVVPARGQRGVKRHARVHGLPGLKVELLQLRAEVEFLESPSNLLSPHTTVVRDRSGFRCKSKLRNAYHAAHGPPSRIVCGFTAETSISTGDLFAYTQLLLSFLASLVCTLCHIYIYIYIESSVLFFFPCFLLFAGIGL